MLALVIWVAGGTLFYMFEENLFENIPNSMYYTVRLTVVHCP